MPIEVWSVQEFLQKAREHIGPELPDTVNDGPSWVQSVQALGQRAHARGDGIAIYENADLGHPEIGEWKVVSYGGPEAQLQTRGERPVVRLGETQYFDHGDDAVRMILPDIGGAINWRYALKAIVPSYEQDAKANEFGTPGYSATPPVEGHVCTPTANCENQPCPLDEATGGTT